MCGIFAIFLNRPLTDADIALGRQGSAGLAHRGPDGEGEFIDRESGVFLGHRRLAIIDLSDRSNQPMQRDNMVVAHNGEIYNFADIRHELEQLGVEFSTSGDVEVVLRAWQTWHTNSLHKFDGMFAFTVWDGRKAELAADPFGEKPLYYAETSEGIYVSSEIGPLAKLLNLSPKLEGERLVAYLSLGYVPPPLTAFAQIMRLPAATALSIENGVIKNSIQYWRPLLGQTSQEAVAPLTESDLDLIHEKLVGSIEQRLVADVPLCLFLSSGTDSSLVAAILARDLAVDVKCVTVAFPGNQASNEAPYAAKIAGHLGLEHTVIESDEHPQTASPQAVIDLFGQPCDSLTALSLMQMSAAVRPNFKVALTGMGGDEIFLGYGKHADFYKWRRWYAMPEALRLPIGQIGRRLAASSTGRLNAAFRQIGFNIGVHDWERYIAHKNFPTIGWLREVAGFETWCRMNFDSGREPIDRQVARFETAHVMPGSRLVATDVSSMRASLELRTPFLSRKLSEAVAQFDPRCFIAFGQKSVLRRLLSRYLPETLSQLPKRGFVFPQDRFLSNFGEALPHVPGVAPDSVEMAWRRRTEEAGWRRLAVRLALADTFAAQFAPQLSE